MIDQVFKSQCTSKVFSYLGLHSQYSNIVHRSDTSTAPALCHFYPRIIEVYPFFAIVLPFHHTAACSLPHYTIQQLLTVTTSALSVLQRDGENLFRTRGGYFLQSQPETTTRSFHTLSVLCINVQCTDYWYSAIRRDHKQTGWPNRHSVMFMPKHINHGQKHSTMPITYPVLYFMSY